MRKSCVGAGLVAMITPVVADCQGPADCQLFRQIAIELEHEHLPGLPRHTQEGPPDRHPIVA